jgi:hypothetical protein
LSIVKGLLRGKTKNAVGFRLIHLRESHCNINFGG